ncbi:putative selenate reductase, YgfK subunit [Desulfonatronum zhilinae]|nr:putative selenate reductase, YgfK subunit [Desulfonatronum zhilinae]
MDRFHPIPHDKLLASLLDELEHGQILGIPKACFFQPGPDDPFTTTRYGQRLETPIGAAAGPHTQLARNLVAAWLCGGRYLELKTVQILDELTLARPCIDMRDEGYNCEWSQELKLEQSFDEYLNGLLLILALRRTMNFPAGGDGRDPGFILNMSAGYDLAGITSPAMTRFLDRMTHCPEDMAEAATRLSRVCPELAGVDLPDGVSTSLTISTMHGCPPDEIQRIALHFIKDRGLHTTLKLNPTLLGPERVRALLQGLGWDLDVPDAVFANDLSLDQALPIIRTLSAAARKRGVEFNLKLTNTLPCVNRSALPEAEQQVYCSGRPLHPLAVHVALLLREHLGQQDSGPEQSEGCPPMSFCAGADAFNTPDLLAAGLGPVTTCSDLLKPGGYARLRQYLDVLKERMAASRAENLDQWQAHGQGLAAYAKTTATARRYAKTATTHTDVKIPRPLPRQDCFTAPCRAACAAGQDIPAYLGHLAQNKPTAALATIRATNPPAHHLGLACDALCRKRCTRGNLDTPLRIREAKAAAARLGGPDSSSPDQPRATSNAENTASVVVHGLDARSVSCAGTLIQAGVDVTLIVPENALQPNKASSPAKRALLTDIADLTALSQSNTPRDEIRYGTLVVIQGTTRNAQKFDHIFTFDNPLPTGPGSLPRAVALGREAAKAYLRSQDLPPQPADRPSRPEADISALRSARHIRDFGPYADPDSGSRKVTDDEAMPLEAARCLRCDSLCEICVTVCPNRAIVALPSFPGPIARGEVYRDPDGKPALRITENRPLADCTQIVILADVCNTCGNCATFCPSSGAPFSDKPRIHLTRAGFEDEQNGYFPATPDHMEILHHGTPASLTRTAEGLRYKSKALTLTLNPDTLSPIGADLPPHTDQADIGPAMEAGLLFTMFMTSPLSYND